MDFFELIKKRRSIRSFKDRPIGEEKLQALLKAANAAPSAGNLQAYEMLVVKNSKLKRELSTAAYNQQFIEEAPLSVVFILDPDRSGRKYDERGRTLYCIQDASIAAAYLQLAAVEFNLGTCWVGAFNEDAVKSVLDLEKRPVAIITVGHPANRPQERSRRDLEDLVSYME